MSHGTKRTGFLIGAGVPFSIKVNSDTNEVDVTGQALIPNIMALTEAVIENLEKNEQLILKNIEEDLDGQVNIEHLLSKVRLLAQAIGNHEVNGLNGDGYRQLAQKICDIIGNKVDVTLPLGEEALRKLVAWICGTARTHPIEIFTTNYDLLLEEAMELQSVPYFDGFSGGNRPFFDPGTISTNDLPNRWVRLWKLHGSLGWKTEGDRVIRLQDRTANELIYPDHLKYNHIRKLPYASMFDRLKDFLQNNDSMLICCGFSFADAHISVAIEEALSANPSASVVSLQFGTLEDESFAVELAKRNANLSVYASDGACIGANVGKWKPGDPLSEDWDEIRATFWKQGTGETSPYFTLGDFNEFSAFLAHVHSVKIEDDNIVPEMVNAIENADDTPDAPN